jgi:hypothetical protein
MTKAMNLKLFSQMNKISTMKQLCFFLTFWAMTAGPLAAQELFNGIGQKGAYNKAVKNATTFYIPHFNIGFETYVETGMVIQEDKMSKLQNNFAAASKGKTYVGQSGSAKTTTILDAGLELSDFQELANDFQAILEAEIEKAGFKVLSLNEMDKYPSYAKVVEKYGSKTERKQGKTAAEDIGATKVRVMPENSLFMFDENSVMRGGGPAFYGMMKKVQDETKAVMLLQNIDIDFSTVTLDVKLDAGTKGKVTKANTEVLPKMRITYNTFDFVGAGGGPNSAPGTITEEMVASNSYQAKIYRDKAKGESLFKSIFSLKMKPDVNFDPFIVEIQKDAYKAAARDLFKQYSQAFAQSLATAAKK